jgi:hypothetical protein
MRADQLTFALLAMAERGERTHCSDASAEHLWLSEHEAERALAAQLCRHCPVEAECLASALLNDERFGVFGGRDFTRSPGKKKAS